VFNATLIGVQVPLPDPKIEQGRVVPVVGTAHVAEERKETFNVPSPAFVYSTERVGPFCPAAIETGPIVGSDNRNAGAASTATVATQLNKMVRISFMNVFLLPKNNSSTFCFDNPGYSFAPSGKFLDF